MKTLKKLKKRERNEKNRPSYVDFRKKKMPLFEKQHVLLLAKKDSLKFMIKYQLKRRLSAMKRKDSPKSLKKLNFRDSI